VVIYDLFIGDILHARLKMVEDVAGPIEESQLPADVSATGVPEARLPEKSETNAQAPRDQRAGT
jgi:hypothetical protein